MPVRKDISTEDSVSELRSRRSTAMKRKYSTDNDEEETNKEVSCVAFV